MRPDTVAEFAFGLDLETTLVPLDATITSAITRMTARFEDLVNDSFSTATTQTLELNGSGTSRLIIPKRTTAVTAVKTRDYAGTLTTQASTVWRFTSSLDAAGAKRVGGWDYIDVVPGQYLTGLYDPYAQYSTINYTELTWPSVWPQGPQMVQVVGTTGWTTCPDDVKRAIALLVSDHFHAPSGSYRRASEWTDGTTRVLGAPVDEDHPFGMPEVDQIFREYRRESRLGI